MSFNQKHTSQNSESINAEVVNLSLGSTKLLLVVVCSWFIFTGLFDVGSTASYFSDTEVSPANNFTADPLLFSVAPATSTIELGAGEQLVVPVMTPDALSEPIQYRVTSQMVDGDSALCQAVRVLATAPFIYNGPLLGLTTESTTNTGPWALTLYIDSAAGVPAGATCVVDLIYSGWDVSQGEGNGYSDEQRVTLTLHYTEPSASGGSAPIVEVVAPQGDTTPTVPVDPVSSDIVPAGDIPPAQVVPTPPVNDVPADTSSSPQVTNL